MNTVTYTFADDLFPVRELIEPAVNKAGFELAENYSGTSKDPALAYIFNYLIENGSVEVVETIAVDVPRLRPNILESALASRYKLNPNQHRILQRIMLSNYAELNEGGNVLNPHSFKDYNYVIAFIYALEIFDTNTEPNAKVIYNEIQKFWRQKYNVSTRAPFSFIQNFGSIASEIRKNKQNMQYNYGTLYEGRNIMRDGLDQVRNRVEVAFMFDAPTVVKLVSLGLTAETIVKYVNAGISNSKDILEWTENMPLEWAEALLSKVP